MSSGTAGSNVPVRGEGEGGGGGEGEGEGEEEGETEREEEDENILVQNTRCHFYQPPPYTLIHTTHTIGWE